MDDDILTFEQLRNLQQKEQEQDTLQELDEDFFERVNGYLDRKRQVGDHLDNREFRNAKHIVEDILDSRQKKILRLGFLSVKSNLQVDNLLPKEEVFFDQLQDQIKEHRDTLEQQVFSFDDGEEPDNEKTEDTMKASSEPDNTEPVSVDENEPDETEQETEDIFGDDTADKDGTDEETSEETIDDQETSSDAPDEEVEEESGDTMTEITITAEVPEFMGVDMSVYGPYEPGDTATVPEENAAVLVEKDSAERVE